MATKKLEKKKRQSSYHLFKGVPIPPKPAPRAKYPFARMKVGDSFSFPVSEWDSMAHALYNFRDRNNKAAWKFERRKIGGGKGRIWRVK